MKLDYFEELPEYHILEPLPGGHLATLSSIQPRPHLPRRGTLERSLLFRFDLERYDISAYKLCKLSQHGLGSLKLLVETLSGQTVEDSTLKDSKAFTGLLGGLIGKPYKIKITPGLSGYSLYYEVLDAKPLVGLEGSHDERSA